MRPRSELRSTRPRSADLLALCLGLLLSMPLQAQGGDVLLVPQVSAGVPGSMFDVDVYVDTGAQLLGAYSLTLTFDPAQLTATGASAGSSGMGAPFVVNPGVGNIIFNDVDPIGVGPPGMLHVAVVHFDLLVACSGSPRIDGEIGVLVDESFLPIGAATPRSLQSVHVTCLSTTVGEVTLVAPLNVDAGANFDVDVYVNTTGVLIGAYSFTVSYDPAEMTATGVSAGTSPLGAPLVVNPGVGSIIWNDVDPIGAGLDPALHVSRIHFTAAAACASNPTVTGSVDILTDPLFTPVGAPTPRPMVPAMLICGGGSPPVSGICGDCDDDRRVTIVDALRAAQIGAGLASVEPTAAFRQCDVTRSLDVTVLDGLTIARYILGMEPLACLP